MYVYMYVRMYVCTYVCMYVCMYVCLAGLSKILLPPKMKKRGRPKGAEKTVIGLPRKKHRGDKPIPFIKKPPLEKERGKVYL